MLFNSYIFIFLFLPISLLGFHCIGNKGHHHIAIAWLVICSLFFYGWWNPAYLGLILISIIFNFSIGFLLGKNSEKFLLLFGVSVNLCLLGYYKYTNFFIDNLNHFFNTDIILETIILPLAISFFTFQQITYLIDAYRGETKEYNFLHYCLFVTFFPQLIAGPIVHHKEMLPQFSNDILYKLKAEHLAVGLTIFFIGLFKKVVLADSVSQYATPVFSAAEQGMSLTFFEAWFGALAYTFQLYFDFSGYSDMALGIARMFGVILPINFFSPYKSNNIIDFWRRWHITLSRFLRDYLYIPLGGSRKGKYRRYVNLMITMLLGGLWHGAGWTFITWGAMHGSYLVINHGWHALKKKIFPASSNNQQSGFFSVFSGRLITFIAIVFAWVVFRAESMSGAINIYTSMLGLHGISLPTSAASQTLVSSNFLAAMNISFQGMFYNDVFRNSAEGVILILILFLICCFAPNTIEILSKEQPALDVTRFLTKEKRMFIIWKPTFLNIMAITFLAVIAIMNIQKESEFLYFQF